MYHQRVKLFIIVVVCLFGVCLWRLSKMQLSPDPSIKDRIEELKLQQKRILGTARGRILDRIGNILAKDEPEFELLIDYRLTSYADERVIKSKLLKASRSKEPGEAIEEQKKEIESKKKILNDVIEKIASFGADIQQTTARIETINNDIWNLREYLAWKRDYADFNSFEEAKPDPNQRLILTAKVDIAEMYQGCHLVDLDNQDDVFVAQIEFADINEIEIVPQNKRVYPYDNVACQIIGWVKPQNRTELFSNNPLLKYYEDELSGFRGTEYVCESVLRGRRGKEVYDIDKELVDRTETQVGRDVKLAIDIGLQEQIQQYLADCNNHSNCNAGIAAVIIEVASGDILSMVSMPVFNLNDARYDYGKLLNDPNKPLFNRALQFRYPPGSVVKPLIYITGAESGKITASEVISCPAKKAPQYWPSCWIYHQYRTGHDSQWTYNNARNAIRGSCNIYFSRLANRLEPLTLQSWLYKFGYGKAVELVPDSMKQYGLDRRFNQVNGYISSIIPRQKIENLSDIPPLKKSHLRMFGIGQGNFRVTPLQAANAMAALARKGLYKKPNLFICDENKNNTSIYLGISPDTIKTVYEGMRAVVCERYGTANKVFKDQLDYFKDCDVNIYGKTGSTQAPATAWFGGFAKDSGGKSIAIAVVVEGGQHGSDHAAPLARDIIDMCIHAGYLGKVPYEEVKLD